MPIKADLHLVFIRLSESLLFIAIAVFGLLMVRRAKSGQVPYLRKIPALDAVEQAIGRATEMGKPVLFAPGISGATADALTSFEGPQYLAGLAVLTHVARLTARYNLQLIVAVKNAELMPIADAICLLSYTSEGKADAYRNDMVRYIAGDQWSYCIGLVGLMQREKPAANILIGPWYGEALIVVSAGIEVGAIQIGGTARPAQAPYFVIACDYSLLGEEVFAAGAYVSREPAQIGTIAGQDISKLLIVAVTIVGAIFATIGLSKIFLNYLLMTL